MPEINTNSAALPNTLPFTCAECSKHDVEEFERFLPVDDWLLAYPEQQLVHLHFGGPTTHEEMSTEETTWILNVSNQLYNKFPNKTFCVIVDMSRSDDSEFPSHDSIALYKQLLHNPQTGKVIFYGVSPGMTFFIKMLTSVIHGKISIADTKQQADAEYTSWLRTVSGK